MKVLILSCNTGGGHNSAAEAMREYFNEVGVSCEIRDALAFKSERKSKLISKGHVFVYKNAPRLFGAGYHFMEQHPPKKGQPSVMYELIKSGTENLYEYVREQSFDLILSTHLFGSIIVTEMKRQFGIAVPSYLITTDYACYPGIEEVEVDRIFIAHESLIPEHEACGIARERLVPTGIPVKASFYTRSENAKCALGIDESQRMILMMCGSMGCGPLPMLAEQIAGRLPEDGLLAVICGSNRKLYDRFLHELPADRVRVIGYTDLVSLYMDAADVIITKPGGLSATEAACKGVPMVLIDAVPGCETKNMDFFTKNGLAVTADTVEGLVDHTISLLGDATRRARMMHAQRALLSHRAAKMIYESILSEVQYVG
ncbi:MAG: glycosyltransferase [Clostridia bacterium]|nr:glycosyltransferase [Clostridia bacterium]